MNKLDTTITGGMNLFLEDIAWTQDTHREAINNLFADFAIGTDTDFIISGAVATITPSTDCAITAGWAYINGLIVKIDAQTVADVGSDAYYLRVEQTLDASGARLTKNTGASINPYIKYRGILYAGTGTATDLILPAERITNKIITSILATDDGWHEVGNDGGATTVPTGLVQAVTGTKLQYKKDWAGNIRVTGMLQNTSGSSYTGSLLFTLPVGFRPPADCVRTGLITATPDVAGVLTNGNIVIGIVPSGGSYSTDFIISTDTV